jgi:hypothetical protein
MAIIVTTHGKLVAPCIDGFSFLAVIGKKCYYENKLIVFGLLAVLTARGR